MPQLLHLLVVDATRAATLVKWFGSRWLLPGLSCPERARAGLWAIAWAERQGLAVDVVGQWLGRVTSTEDGIDWLVVVRTRQDASIKPPAALSWMPLDRLTSGALLPYQQWAVDHLTRSAGLPSVAGPFGAFTWPDEVTAWVREIAPAFCTLPAVPLRITAHEVVIGFSDGRGRIYFKGLAPDRSDEARITTALSRLAPDSFSRTRALETRPDGSVWWLAEECPGSAPDGHMPIGRAVGLAQASAGVQQRIAARLPATSLLPPLSFASAFEWGSGLLRNASPAGRADAACRMLERAIQHVRSAPVPGSWVSLDLDPRNVLVDDAGAVRFIDLSDSFAGPAPLALAALARRITLASDDSLKWPAALERFQRAYEQAWVPQLRPVDWQMFDAVAGLFDAYLGWKRVLKASERGEVHGAIDLAARRLSRQLEGALRA